MRTSRGFALIELIIIIAIIALLAGLITPVFLRAKQSANEAICVSNLKQFHVALEMYRADWSTTDVGTPAQMGFPIFADSLLPPQECRGLDRRCASPGVYTMRWPSPDPQAPYYSEEAFVRWAEYVGTYGSSAILLYDASHQDHCPNSEFSRRRVLGLNLGGSVYWRVRRGDPFSVEWWHEAPQGGS